MKKLHKKIYSTTMATLMTVSIISGNSLVVKAEVPVFNIENTAYMPALNEDDTSSQGILISQLLSNQVDSAALEAGVGIAITDVDNSNGQWQYYSPGAGLWYSIAPVSDTNAFTFYDDIKVRFVPADDWNGVATFKYKLWDKTGGFANIQRDVDTTGEAASVFSVDKGTAEITVNPENDAPYITEINGGDYMRFNGNNNYVTMPDFGIYGDSFTVEGYVKVNSYQTWMRLFDTSNGMDNYNLHCAFDNGIMTLEGIPQAGPRIEDYQVRTQQSLPLNTWVHVAVVYDSSLHEASIYWNGLLKAKGEMNLDALRGVSRENNWLGKSSWDQDGYFSGGLRDMRFWSVAKSQNEIISEMNSDLNGNEPNLVANYKLNNPNDGTTAVSSTGNNNGLIINGNWQKDTGFVSSLATSVNQPATKGFKVFDVDGDNVDVTVSSTNPALAPNNGSNLFISGTGTDRVVNIIPAQNVVGTATIIVTVNDGLSTQQYSFLLSVKPLTNNPTADGQSISTQEDSWYNGLLTGTSMIGNNLIFSKVQNASNGTAVVYPNGYFEYLPNPGFSGQDSFTFKTFDGEMESNETTVDITVNPVEDAPVANAGAITIDEDTTYNGTLSAEDPDEGDQLLYLLIDGPSNGTLQLNGDGKFEYTPNQDFNGHDSFSFRVNDGSLNSDIVVEDINVNSINDIPKIMDDSKAVDENTTLNFGQDDFVNLYKDVEKTPLESIKIVSLPDSVIGKLKFDDGEGLVDVTEDQIIQLADLDKMVFVPQEGQSDVTASFTWEAYDGEDFSAPATMNIGIGSNAYDVAKALNALSIGYSIGDSEDNVKNDITLPVTGDKNTIISWKSENQNYVSDGGVVTRPAYVAEDQYVNMVATVTKGGVSLQKNFVLKVSKLELTDAEAVMLDKEALKIGFAEGDTEQSVTKDMVLPTIGENGTTINWIPTNPFVVDFTGKVFRPLFSGLDSDVTLTANIIKGEMIQTKNFTLKVLKSLPATDAYLKDLNIGSLQLSPGFNKHTTAYSGTVGNGVASVSLQPLFDDPMTVKVNNENVLDGGAVVQLNVGSNTIKIDVIAQDGVTKKTYNLYITRIAPVNTSVNQNTPTTTTPEISTPKDNSVDIIVNGKSQGQSGTVATTTESGKTITKVILDQKKIEEKLNSEGNKAQIVIPINDKADKAIGELNGEVVKNMEKKEAVLVVKTVDATYELPAGQINIDDVSSKIGKQVELKDIKVSVEIAKAPADTVTAMENTAKRAAVSIIAPPVDFTITCSNGDKKVQISKFNNYIERMVAIPEGVDPSKVTTGIVFRSDGSFAHVPTEVVKVDGKYFAKINSLTNSTYSVIWNPKEMVDVEKHWAKQDVNDMASRLVVNGYDGEHFAPDKSITRSEFAAIIVRALGLTSDADATNFKDVKADEWYYNSIKAAYEYGIIKGYGNESFMPEREITREEAMAMIARAMKITKLDVNVSEQQIGEQLAKFTDAKAIDEWAKAAIAACISNGIVTGNNGLLQVKTNVTRAQTAALIRRTLIKSNLIDDNTKR